MDIGLGIWMLVQMPAYYSGCLDVNTDSCILFLVSGSWIRFPDMGLGVCILDQVSEYFSRCLYIGPIV